jgi:hypothetical protein
MYKNSYLSSYVKYVGRYIKMIVLQNMYECQLFVSVFKHAPMFKIRIRFSLCKVENIYPFQVEK